MKWVRYQLKDETSYGLLDNNIVTKIDGSPFSEYQTTDQNITLDRVFCFKNVLYRISTLDTKSIQRILLIYFFWFNIWNHLLIVGVFRRGKIFCFRPFIFFPDIFWIFPYFIFVFILFKGHLAALNKQIGIVFYNIWKFSKVF